MANKKSKDLFRMEEKGKTADNKGCIYDGFVGGHKLGSVVAANKTAGKKKLMAIARKLLK